MVYPSSVAVLVLSGAVYVGIIEYFELFCPRQRLSSLFRSALLPRFLVLSPSPPLYMARHLRVQGNSVRVRLILPHSVFTGKWVLSTDGGLIPG